MGLFNRAVLDREKYQELTLSILSFAGGINTISEDQAMKNNEARNIINWDANSLGGMIRSKGFNEVADGGVTYTNAPDLIIEHKDSGGTAVYGVCEGDLVIKSGSTIAQEDASTFTSGTLCHAVSAGEALWITNSTDNLYRKTVGVAIAAATGQPANACDRIYTHKQRLIAEGATSTGYRVYGSRAGTGNWNSANTWSASNDAWSIDLPADTQGCAPGFPSGDEVLVFTKNQAYSIFNFPNVAQRPIKNSRGCSAPYSIAAGDEGVYFVSQRPTLGVFLFDGINWADLTQYNRDVNVELIDFSKRIYGIYRDRKYHLFFNESGSGVTYPNRWWIFDAKHQRWMKRNISSGLSDNMGYPTLLRYTNNELYAASSANDKFYELETEDDSDESQDTEALYETKDYSSIDFSLASGGQFPIDDVRIKLTKMIVTYFGTTGSIGVQWEADRGKNSGTKTIGLTADGDLINTTFTVNTSNIVTTPPDKTEIFEFDNSAIGRRFNFTFTNNDTGTRPKIKKIKLHAIAYDEA